MIKYLKHSVTLLFIFLLFTACGRSPYRGLIQKQEPYLQSVRYETFHGSDEWPFTLATPTRILVEVETLAGNIDIAIYSTEDTEQTTPYFYETTMQTTQMGGELPAGSYVLMATAKQHKGGFGVEYHP